MCHHLTEATDEAPIKVSEPMEALEFLLACWRGPCFYRLNLFQVGLELVKAYDNAQEWNGLLVKHAFFCLDKKTILEQADVFPVFRERAGENQNVVEVSENSVAQKVMEHQTDKWQWILILYRDGV